MEIESNLAGVKGVWDGTNPEYLLLMPVPFTADKDSEVLVSNMHKGSFP